VSAYVYEESFSADSISIALSDSPMRGKETSSTMKLSYFGVINFTFLMKSSLSSSSASSWGLVSESVKSMNRRITPLPMLLSGGGGAVEDVQPPISYDGGELGENPWKGDGPYEEAVEVSAYIEHVSLKVEHLDVGWEGLN